MPEIRAGREEAGTSTRPYQHERVRFDMAEASIPQPGGVIQLGDFLKGDHRFPAVYFLHDEGEVVYVGQSKTLQWRIEQHLTEGVKEFDGVSFVACCVSRLLDVEGRYIRELTPRYNNCAIATKARREAAYIPDAPPVRVIDGQMLVGSLGLSRIMHCDRAFARMLLDGLGKQLVSIPDAFWLACFVKPADYTEQPRKSAAAKRAARHRNRKKVA